MRIGVDARFLGPEGTGLGRYIERLLHHLQDLETEYEIVVFLRPENEALFEVRNDRFQKVIADARWYTLKEQFVMPRLIRREKIDLMHFGHFNVTPFSRRPFVVTIHDIIKSEHADKSASTRSAAIYYTKHLVYEMLIRHAVRGSCRVIVPTEYVRQKVLKRFDVPEDSVTVTYEGIDHDHKPAEVSRERQDAVLQKYGIRRPFLLYVGNSYPYKNLDLVLDALPRLPEKYMFVNPCARSVFYDRLLENVQKRGLEQRVVLPGFVPDDDLSVLYSAADLYVFPSLSEGFGLPALEAMQMGLPVVAARASCLPEVLGDAAVFFDPKSVDAFVSVISRVLSSSQEQDSIREKGFECVKKYSWKRMARQTRDVYQECLSS